MQCLDVDKLIQLFTAVLLERRILLRSNKSVEFHNATLDHVLTLYHLSLSLGLQVNGLLLWNNTLSGSV